MLNMVGCCKNDAESEEIF